MNIQALYAFGKKEIGSDCLLLTEFFFGLGRREIALYPEKEPENQGAFFEAVQKRKGGYPLQYLLGYWYFGGMKLKVTEGVLIPREDTLALVEAAAAYIGHSPMKGLDLCAGTGAVALAVERACPQAEITALELFERPLACLRENMKTWSLGRTGFAKADVLKGPGDYQNLDFILSNPPYIGKSELPSLQAEVRHEPPEALDGGEDGLLFYREIIGHWKKALKPGGLLAVETGDDQKESVTALFKEAGFRDIQTKTDACGLHRIVSGLRLSE